MKIAIVGYGGMGKMIEADAKARDIEIQSIIDPKCEGATHEEITSESMQNVDVAIDFTHPSVIMGNIKKYCDLGVNAVVGTTGWYDNVDMVRKMAEDAGIKFMWASNFSMGVNMYFRIIEAASKLLNVADDYDVWGNEIHHHHKADSPSGTAKSLAEIITKNVARKDKVVYEMLNRKIEPNEMHFASVRGGPVNFEHTIGLDSSADCITIKHAARNRGGYSKGAVQAALWLNSQESGYYELDDFMSGLFTK